MKLQGLMKVDAERIAESVWPEVSQEITEAIYEISKRDIRQFVKIINRAQNIMVTNKLEMPNVEIIEMAGKMILRRNYIGVDMSEKKDLPADLGINKKTTNKVLSLQNDLVKVLTTATLRAFEIGKILYTVEANNSKGRQAFVDWVTKDLKISWQTCLNYKKLFVFFYQDPERLENLTIMQAYAEAGIAVKKALPPPKEEYEEVFTAGEEEEAYDAELAEIFKRNPLSGIQLKKIA
ncbi:hypothetical protein [Treponema phagedenis]|uniref:hypothetical protein n=2 Tax=Treponema phagedenis TaxID=162 RepID=UPI002091A45F|nr:hypothetical protein [Treponema phagedenis]